MSINVDSPGPKERLVEGARRFVQRASVEIGRRTARSRVLPSFIMVGGQRCGTTSLFRALSEHASVMRPNYHKGVNYFDLGYANGADWYAGHFPHKRAAAKRARNGKMPEVFEASGYYMFHPFAVPRLAQALPDVKLVAMLRDPVERAYSAWKHESARGFETESFADALDMEDERLEGEIDKMAADVTYESLHHRHHAYRRRGDYLGQLQSAAEHLSREQIHVMYSEDFFTEPDREFARLEEFLGVEHDPSVTIGQHNARPSKSIPDDVRQKLRVHYEGERDALEAFVGSPAPWPRADVG